MQDELILEELMFFSQNTTNLGRDHYGLGDKLLEYDRDNNDVNRIIKRIYLVKSKGVKVNKQKNIGSDVEGIVLDFEFVLSIYPRDNDILGRKSSVICCGKLPKFDDSDSKLNPEEIQKIVEKLESKILNETENFAHKISRNLPHDLKDSGQVKYFLQKFYKKINPTIFNNAIDVLIPKRKNQWLWAFVISPLLVAVYLASSFFTPPLITTPIPLTTNPVTTTAPKPPNNNSSTTTAPTAKPQILRLGMQGSDVKLLQQKLISLGSLKDKDDGIFGYKTKAGVETFQREHQLKIDGVVGPATWKALLKETMDS